MLIAAVSDAAFLHQRIKFWDDVHGFAMPAMSKGLEVDAYTEGLTKDKLVSSIASVFDLPLQTMQAKQPSFVAPFTLEVTKDTIVHGFLNWFDTWFVPLPHPALPSSETETGEKRMELKGGEIIAGLPPVTTQPVTEADVEGIALKGREEQRLPTSEEERAGGETVSFTTGPEGKETHWKQTVLLLKEPLHVSAGTLITGTMHVVPSTVNSRELDAEIHWVVRTREEHEARLKGELKKVETMTVQVWAVR
jgi:protein arginine N-methyltransferase 3